MGPLPWPQKQINKMSLAFALDHNVWNASQIFSSFPNIVNLYETYERFPA